ncbi:MAG: hypothetical protein ABI831_11665 [Betaproteobacteria bacterium]
MGAAILRGSTAAGGNASVADAPTFAAGADWLAVAAVGLAGVLPAGGRVFNSEAGAGAVVDAGGDAESVWGAGAGAEASSAAYVEVGVGVAAGGAAPVESRTDLEIVAGVGAGGNPGGEASDAGGGGMTIGTAGLAVSGGGAKSTVLGEVSVAANPDLSEIVTMRSG